jgi:RNA polymerase sigma factor (sigma-70 family)
MARTEKPLMGDPRIESHLPGAGATATADGHDEARLSQRDLEETDRSKRDLLLRIARRITRNRADTEDVVQQAFLRAYALDLQMPREQLLHWLKTVVRRLAVDRLRGRAIHLRYAALVWARDESARAYVPSMEKIDELLSALPSVLQPTFRLWCAGSSYEAIASTQRVPVGTIAARVWRAKARMRAVWDAD